MLRRLTATLCLAAFALALVASGPAFAAAAKKAMHPASPKATTEATADSLNAQSLTAAQAGKNFTPPK